ncbi:MAG: 4Fe-4S dicluster domain-containing protein [Pseudomonadota bacterium]
MKEAKERIEKAKRLSRRKFLKGMVSGIGALALPVPSLHAFSWEEFFQKHFKRMTPEEINKTLRRLEEKYAKSYSQKVTVSATPAMKGVLFGYALDLSRCIGCRRCAYACAKENNSSRKPQIQWIRVVRLREGHLINLEEADHYYNPDKVPEEGYFYMPVQCHQCENPPCVKVCPTKATWKEPDGIVVVDYNWCIGCRYCMVACPYFGRRFNWSKPFIPREELNPETEYLGNRPRWINVMEKCTFCLQRARKGRYPACVEACPVGARKFGNLLDPESEISYILKNERVFRLKEDLNTDPKFYYFFAT